jgi:hypothetical protein
VTTVLTHDHDTNFLEWESAVPLDLGVRIRGFYRACRNACGPPMAKIETLEVGELWFYDDGHVEVMACLGERSLMVAYISIGLRDDVVAEFRSAHAWLRGEHADPPAKLNLRFAVWEETSGNILVRQYRPGDWQRILFPRPTQQVYPSENSKGT